MKRRPLLILLFVLVAGGGLFVWNATRDTQARTFLLADGSQLTFRAITVGTNHSYCFGNVFQRVAARIPGKLGDKLHGKTVVKAPGWRGTNVVFWFYVRKNPVLTSFVNIHQMPDGEERELFWMQPAFPKVDRSLRTTFSGRLRLPSGDLSEYCQVTNLPHTLPIVRLKLTIWRGPADEEESVEFTAPNPFYRKEP
jgi:hypothetical protein